MEFDGDQENSRARSGPVIFGAIFMCNRSTKKECFERRLFGLPASQASFVKKIKTGTVLFLFEHEERKLYGVFRACSDGGWNIVPHAFNPSGKQFPAQVRFKPLWDCHPVPECDFRDAFKDNYYTSNKFAFGLAKDQVRKLLLLFSSRKRDKLQRSKNLTTSTKVMKKTGKSGLGTVRVTEKGRFVTTGRTKTAHDGDNDSDPVNLTRYPLSPRPNQTSILGNSEKPFLGRDDPLVEDPLHAVEPRLSDFRSSPSQGDTDNQHVITSYSNSYLSRDSSFLYRNSSSFGVDHNTPACAHSSYSQTSTDTLFPQSRSQLVPNHLERESLIMSSTRNHIPDAIDNLRDYIPLNTDSVIPEYGYLGYKSKDSNNFEGYNSRMPFREPSIATMPIARNERDNMCSSPFSFTSGRGPSPVPDHDYVSAELRYWKYEPSTATLPLSSEGTSQLGNYPQESQSVDLYERLGYDYSTDRNEDYRSHLSLRSDTHKTRTSVFSRLTKVKDTIAQDQNYMGNTDMDMSVDQIMAELHQNHNRIWKGKKKSKRSIACDDDHDDFDKLTEMEMSEDANLVNKEKFSEREGGESPLVNFKRRSEIRKVRGETEMKGCVEGVDCESLAVTSGKRRKLVRPSFGLKELNYDKSSAGEEGNEGNQNELSQNVGLQNKGNNDKAVKGSTREDPKGGGVSQELGARDCFSNVKGLVQDAPDRTGDNKGIAEKGSSKARKELGDGYFKSEIKGKTVQFSITSNTGEEFKEEGQSLELGARNCSLNVQVLSQAAPGNTGGQKQITKEGSNKALKDLVDGSFKSEGKGNTIACSVESNAVEDHKEVRHSRKHGARDCSIKVQGLSQHVTVSSGVLKELAEKGSSKALQVLGDGSFKIEGKRNTAVLFLESNTGEGFKEKRHSQGLGARDGSLMVQGLSKDADDSTVRLNQIAKISSTKAVQELGDGSFESEGKGKKVKFSLESNTGAGLKEKEQSQGLGARDFSLPGLSLDAPVHTEADKGKGKAVQELTDGSLTCEGKRITKESLEESNTSQADLSIGKTDNRVEQKTNSLSVSKDETTAMLVDDGVCKREIKAEESLPLSQCEPQQTTVRRFKKIVKRAKKEISNPSS